jgi:hypothetical protein
VLIAGVVVAYMFGFLGSTTKQNMVNKCSKFKIMLCQYATQFASLGYNTPGEAMAAYLTATLYSYGSNGFTNVTCTPSGANSADCGGITFSYDPNTNQISVTGSNVYIDTRLRVYFGQQSSHNDYVCLTDGQSFKCG